MSMQSFLTDGDAFRSPPHPANRPANALPTSLFGHSPCTVLKGNVIAESDQDLANLFARYQNNFSTRNGPAATLGQEPPALNHFLGSIQECVTSGSVPGQTTDAKSGGNMMEMEHVPKARLLMRHPIKRTQSSAMHSAEANSLPRCYMMDAGGFLRSSSAPVYGLSVGCDGSAMPMYCPLSQHLRFPTASGYDFRAGLMPEAYLPPSMHPRSSFDVTKLGSFRLQQIGTSAADPMGIFQSSPADPYGLYAMQKSHSYEHPSAMNQGMYGQSLPQPGFMLSPSTASFSNESWMSGGLGRSMETHPHSRMIPTPQFMNGSNQQVGRSGGPIELPASKLGARVIQSSPRSTQQKAPQVMQGRGADISEQGILDFVNEFLYQDTSTPSSKSTKAPAKKGRGSSPGITKAKAPKKSSAKQRGKLTTGKPAQRKTTTAKTPKTKPADKRTLYDQITSQQLDDITSDATCLIWMPVPSESMPLPYEGESVLSDSLKSSERDDVSEVFRILEDAGLEPMPSELNPFPSSCPLLPPPSSMCPSAKEDVLELVFLCLGKAVASAEELQSVMKTWLSLTHNGPRKNPGLDIWRGYDYIKVFADDEIGCSSIIDCLSRHTSRFNKAGVNHSGQEIWECNNMEFLGKPSAEAQLQDGMFSGHHQGNVTKRKRKVSGSWVSGLLSPSLEEGAKCRRFNGQIKK